MPTMNAIRIERFGGPEELEFRQIATPTPNDGEVLVKVHAASVNPVDYKIRSGKYPSVKDDKLAYILGRDVLVSTLNALSPEEAAEYGVRATRFTVTETGSELAEIADLIDAGKVRPKVSDTFVLENAASAHKLIEEGHTEGKIVLRVT